MRKWFFISLRGNHKVHQNLENYHVLLFLSYLKIGAFNLSFIFGQVRQFIGAGRGEGAATRSGEDVETGGEQ